MQKTDYLADFVRDVYCPERDIEPSTQAFYLCKAVTFEETIGRKALVSDLNDVTINKYLTARLSKVARDTVRGERSTLLAFWRSTYDGRILDVPPGRVKPIKKIPKIVEGWTDEELARLIGIIAGLRGCFRMKFVERGPFWLAVVLALYDTGLRLGDLLRLEAKQLLAGRPFPVCQHKTRKLVDVALSPETIEAIKRIYSPSRPRPFDILNRRSFYIAFADLCKAAGLQGRTKRLRITSGSRVEQFHPGEGHLHLGNGREVFASHYEWRAVTKRPTRLPPKIGA